MRSLVLLLAMVPLAAPAIRPGAAAGDFIRGRKLVTAPATNGMPEVTWAAPIPRPQAPVLWSAPAVEAVPPVPEYAAPAPLPPGASRRSDRIAALASAFATASRIAGPETLRVVPWPASALGIERPALLARIAASGPGWEQRDPGLADRWRRHWERVAHAIARRAAVRERE